MSHQNRGLEALGGSKVNTKTTADLRVKTYQLIRLGCVGRQKRRGATAVEFAVVAPIVLLLVFGMIEFGRMIVVQQVITNAAREGAEHAQLPGTTSEQVNKTIRNYLAGKSVSDARVSLTPIEPANAGDGEQITVTVSIPFHSVSWLPSPAFLGSTNLSARSVVRRESGRDSES